MSNRIGRVCCLLSMALVCLLMKADVRAENWPQWRGPQGNGICTEQGLPATWSSTENVVWRLPLPGAAGATPAVWDDRIFLTSAKDDELVLLCVDTAGKLQWERTIGSGNTQVRVDEGNSASPSPVTDGKHVWAMITNGNLACFDFSGKEVWKTNLQDRYGAFNIQFGMTSTPVLDGEKLYIQLFHTGYHLLAALDKHTGNEVWRHDRQTDARAECEHAYTSPMVYRDARREFLLVHGCDYVTGHDLNDGRELFRCGKLNFEGAKYNAAYRFVASAVAAEGLIVVPSCKNGPVLGLSVEAQGDITNSAAGHLWRMDTGTPDVPSPLIHEGLVYLCSEKGILTCLEAKTGKPLYQERAHQHLHRASPLFADGKIYLMARDGTATVVKAGPAFEILSTNELGEAVSASPAVSNGRIYLRSFDALYAIGKK